MIFALAALLLLAAGEPLAVERKAAPDKVKLGEAFLYSVRVQHPPGARVELATSAELGAFDLVSEERHRQDGTQSSTTEFGLKLALFELGKQKIPTLDLVVTEGGQSRTQPVEGLEVEALSSLPPDAADQGAALYDIKPPEDVPVPSFKVLWALMIAALCFGLVWAALRFAAKPKPLPPPPPPEPLAVRTRRALDALKAQDLPGQGKVREFYFRLSEIVRGHLGEHYRFEALECTGSELLTQAERVAGSTIPRAQLADFVLQSDLAKFAKAPVRPEDCERSFAFAHQLVEITTAGEVTHAG